MATYPCAPCCSIFDGMTREQLLKALADAQNAYIQLSMGRQGVSYSYTQGDGGRAVTYTKANIGDLMALINQLKSALGLPCGGRRAISFAYR